MGYDWKISKYSFKVKLLHKRAKYPSAGTKALLEKHYGVLVYKLIEKAEIWYKQYPAWQTELLHSFGMLYTDTNLQ